MKFSNRSLLLIVVAAVLVSTVGIGLLIRQACREPRLPADAGQEIREQRLALSQQRPGGGDSRETREDPIRQQELRAQMLEKMASLTEEEKARFRAEIREQFRSRTTRVAEAQRAKALRDRMAAANAPLVHPEPVLAEPADANAAREDAAGTATEPNQAGQH